MPFRVVRIEVDAEGKPIETEILSLHSTRPDAEQAAEAAARAFAHFGPPHEQPSWWARDDEGRKFRIWAEGVPPEGGPTASE